MKQYLIKKKFFSIHLRIVRNKTNEKDGYQSGNSSQLNQSQQQPDDSMSLSEECLSKQKASNEARNQPSKQSSKKLKTKSLVTITPPVNNSSASFNSSPSSASSSSSTSSLSSSSYQSSMNYMNNYNFNSDQVYSSANMLAHSNNVENNSNGYSIQNILNFAAQQYVSNISATNINQGYSPCHVNLLKRKQQNYTQNSSNWLSNENINTTNANNMVTEGVIVKDMRRTIEVDSNSSLLFFLFNSN